MTAPNVKSLIRALGKDLTLVRASGAAFNAQTGGYGERTYAFYNFRGIMKAFRTEEIDNSNVLATDKKLLVDASSLAIEPEVGDYINAQLTPTSEDSVVEEGVLTSGSLLSGRKILSTRRIEPRGVVVAFTCQLR